MAGEAPPGEAKALWRRTLEGVEGSMRATTILTTLLVLLVAMVPTRARQPTGSVFGTISDTTGEGLSKPT